MRHDVVALLAVLITSACAKRDDCGELYDKITAAWDQGNPAFLGVQGPREDWVRGCRKDLAKIRELPMMKCVLGATGKKAVSKCITDSIVQGGEAPDTKSDVQLMMLAASTKEIYRRTGAFPKGHTGPMPGKPCCSFPDHRCPVSQDWATDPIWSALGVSITEPTPAQFSYDSDGTSATLSATYEMACDGKPVTSKSKIEVAPDGSLSQHWADDHH